MENDGKKKRVLFIDRDGTLVVEPPVDYQLDSLEKLEFIPGVFRNLHFIARNLDFERVIVTNQDGLGTPSFPMETFLPAHEKMLRAFENEGITFDDIIIDRTFEHEHQPTRKPGTALLGKYLTGDYDLETRLSSATASPTCSWHGISERKASCSSRTKRDGNGWTMQNWATPVCLSPTVGTA